MDEDKRKIYTDYLEAIETALASAKFDSTLLFRHFGARLRDMRDALRYELKSDEASVASHNHSKQAIPNPAQHTVFVAVYQADGNNLKKWENLLNNLTVLSVGRPVYKTEEAIAELIKTKPDRRRDAYVEVAISKDDIMPPIGGKVLHDRQGNELLTIREGAIRPDNIIKFVHVSGYYDFVDGKCVLH